MLFHRRSSSCFVFLGLYVQIGWFWEVLDGLNGVCCGLIGFHSVV